MTKQRLDSLTTAQIAGLLRSMRRQMGLSIDQLSEVSGASRAAIYHTETLYYRAGIRHYKRVLSAYRRRFPKEANP